MDSAKGEACSARTWMRRIGVVRMMRRRSRRGYAVVLGLRIVCVCVCSRCLQSGRVECADVGVPMEWTMMARVEAMRRVMRDWTTTLRPPGFWIKATERGDAQVDAGGQSCPLNESLFRTGAQQLTSISPSACAKVRVDRAFFKLNAKGHFRLGFFWSQLLELLRSMRGSSGDAGFGSCECCRPSRQCQSPSTDTRRAGRPSDARASSCEGQSNEAGRGQ
ncbi:hypothetical protein L1887_53694 [Cichorium endivia]|nr:hypothetical protein L1887_53694 [Cichorium endivia]